MSAEGGERAFGERHFCAGSRPRFRFSCREILGLAQPCVQILGVTELVGKMERRGS